MIALNKFMDYAQSKGSYFVTGRQLVSGATPVTAHACLRTPAYSVQGRLAPPPRWLA